jgi:pantetheine-phosphate adenylyltransferase
MEPNSVNHALLVVTLADLSIPYSLAPVIAVAAKSTRQRLTVVLLSPLFEYHHANTAPFSRTEHWDDVQRLLSYVYVQATLVSHDMGKVLMEVDVLLRGNNELENLGVGVDACVRVEGGEFY